MFQRILVANRGEIALRVIRACKDMGIEVVAVFSEADRGAPYLALADQAICIGPAVAAYAVVSSWTRPPIRTVRPASPFSSVVAWLIPESAVGWPSQSSGAIEGAK